MCMHPIMQFAANREVEVRQIRVTQYPAYTPLGSTSVDLVTPKREGETEKVERERKGQCYEISEQ